MTRRSATLGQAAAIVSAGVLLSRLLGVVREQVIGALLGRTAETDLYVNAFLVPDYLFFLLAGGYLAITLVPLLTEHHATGDDHELNRTFTAVFRTVAGLSALLFVGGLLLAGPLVDRIFGSLSEADVARLVPMTRIAIGMQAFFVLGGLFTAAQYAEKRFAIPALGPLVYNSGIIVGGLLGAAFGDPTPEAFLVGGVVGAAIGSFGLQWWGAHRLGIRLVGGVGPRHPGGRRYLALAFPLMVGQTVVALDEQWPRLFGQIVGDGTTAGLNFARRLNMLPVGVIAQAAGVASFPFMARLVSERRTAEMRHTVNVALRSGLAVAGLAVALIVPLREVLVRIIYQWGAFTDADTDVVSTFLLYYALSIPFWVGHQVLTRAFYAQRRMWLPVALGTATTVATVPILFALTDAYGGNGIAAGSSIGVALYTLAIVGAWYRGGGREAVEFVWYLAKLAAAAVVAGLVAFAALRLTADTLPSWTVSVIVAAAGAGTYLGVGRLLGVAEVMAVPRRLRRLVRRAD